jgi:phage-related protein
MGFGNLGTVWAEMGLKYSKLQKGFKQVKTEIKTNEKSIQKSLTKLGGMATNVGTTMSMTLTAPLSALGGLMIKAASDAQETQGQFDQVFGEISKSVNVWANQYADDIGRSRTQIKEFASGLQDTFVPLGFARDQAARLSQNLVQLGVDVASFKNKADSKVIDDFNSALVGNHETVKKYGIIINESRLKSEAYKQGIAEVGAELTDQQKVLARYSIIVNSTKDAQGDASRTSGNFANVLKRFKGELRNTAEVMGKEMLPMATKIIKKLTNLTKWFGGLSPVVKKTLLIFGGLVTVLGPVITIIGVMVGAIGNLIPVLSAVWSWLSTTTVAIGGMTTPIGWVIAAVIAFAAAWKGNFLGLRDVTKAMIKEVAGMMGGLWKLLKGDFKDGLAQIRDSFNTGGEEITTAITSGFKDTFSKAKDLVQKSFGSEIAHAADKGAEEAKPDIEAKGKEIAESFNYGLTEEMKKLVFSKLGDTVGGAFDDALSNFDYKVDMGELNTREQIVGLQKIRDELAENEEQEREANVRIYELKKQLFNEVLDQYEEDVSKQQLSTAEKIKLLQEEVKYYAITADQKKAIEEEILNLKRQQAEEEKRLASNRYNFLLKLGQIDLKEHRKRLQNQLKGVKKYSDEWIRLQGQIADTRLKMFDQIVKKDNLSTEEQINNINKILQTEKLATEEKIRLQERLNKLRQKRNSSKKSNNPKNKTDQNISKLELAFNTFTEKFQDLLSSYNPQRQEELAQMSTEEKAEAAAPGFAQGAMTMASGDVVGGAIEMITSLFAQLEGFNEFIGGIMDAFQAFLEPLIPVFESLFQALQPLIEPLILIGQLFGRILAMIMKVIVPIIKVLAKVLAFVVETIISVINFFIKAYNMLLGWLFGEIDTIDSPGKTERPEDDPETGGVGGSRQPDTRASTNGGFTSQQVANTDTQIITILREIAKSVVNIDSLLSIGAKGSQGSVKGGNLKLTVNVQPGAVQVEGAGEEGFNQAGEQLANMTAAKVLEILKDNDFGLGLYSL